MRAGTTGASLRMSRATLGAALLLVAALAIAAPPARAATTFGSTSPTGTSCASGPLTIIQTGSPAITYAAPNAGVITSWSYKAGSMPPATIKLRVVRPTSTAGTYTTIGLTQTVSPSANQLITSPARIPVAANDFIGFTTTSATGFDCGGFAAGFNYATLHLDPALGSTDAYAPAAGVQVNISATLEPDADGDGFGDETQDACPDDAAVHSECPFDTTITKAPPRTTKRKRATIEFSSDRSGGSFECALDGSAFAGCTSPFIKNVSKGNHAFQVRAVSPGGKADETPATVTWKVKKKRKKHKH